MKNQPVLLIFIVGLIVLLGWAVAQHFMAGIPTQEPVRSQPAADHMPPPSAQDAGSLQPVVADPGLAKPQEENIGSQQLIPDKRMDTVNKVDNTRVNLSDHTYTIEKEEKKSFEILPGVNLKSRRVHVEIDEEANQWIEIERNPPNSNSEYQILLKKKF